ncbi:hypothetical protein D3C78_563470 [compost metagenome]
MFSERVSQTFNLGLEVLKGCGYSCAGCTVEKNFAPFDMSEEDTNDLLALLADLKSKDFRLLELKLGPTDITSADNGFQVLRHPSFRKIAEQFKVLTINMAMLHDRNLEEIAALVDEIMPGKFVNVGTPLTLKNACNDKYIEILKDRLARFQGMLKKAEFSRLYVTVNVEAGNLAQFTKEAFHKLRFMDFGSGIEKVIEFPFVAARQGFDNIIAAEQFKRDLTTFINFAKERVDSLEFITIIPGNKEGYEYTYRGGNLYSTIVLIENLTIYKDNFKLNKPWTADSLIADREEAYYGNLEKYSDHPECGDCCFLDSCSRCDVQRLMEEVGSDKCLMDMKNRWDLMTKEGH